MHSSIVPDSSARPFAGSSTYVDALLSESLISSDRVSISMSHLCSLMSDQLRVQHRSLATLLGQTNDLPICSRLNASASSKLTPVGASNMCRRCDPTGIV